jgi:hypothetical protein
MSSHYPIVLEGETTGTVSAYVVGVPGVFAAANTEAAPPHPSVRRFKRI